MTEKPSMDDILKAINNVISGTRTGSAIDRYNVESLWDLGDLLILRGGIEVGGVPDAISIRVVMKQNDIETGPTLLRNAVRVRRYWTNRESYKFAVASLNTYGKLKEAIQIFNPEIGVQDADLIAFLQFARTATYTDILERARLLKRKYLGQLPEILSKTDEFADALDSAASLLRIIIEKKDTAAINAVKSELTPEKSKSLRMVLSAIQSPDVYARYKSKVRNAVLPSPETLSILGHQALGEVVNNLSAILKENPAIFPRIVEDIGYVYIGELATLLKAIETPEDLARYFKNKDVLNRFLSRKEG